MSGHELESTNEALAELLTGAGIAQSEDAETLVDKVWADNISKGPGTYSAPGIVERNGLKVIVGNKYTQYVVEPPKELTLEDLLQSAEDNYELAFGERRKFTLEDIRK